MPGLKKYLLFFLLAAPFAGIAQDKNEALIDWSASRRLTWNDYKASPDRESDAAASTTTYLGIEYNISSDNFTFKINSRFSKDHSWGLHKTAYILNHEQGHFDIAEIFARKLNKRMSEYKFNKRTYDHDLSRIYQEIVDEKEAMQDEYDKETNHSINRPRQDEWLIRIASMLDGLKEYADY